MFIKTPPKSQARKELKVNLPVHQHRALRTFQVQMGREAPLIVAEALDLYFTKLRKAAETSAQAV